MLRKKLLCLNLAILLLLTLLPVQVVSAVNNTYEIKVGETKFNSDVDQTSTYFDYIATAHTLKLYNGYNEGSIFASGDLKIVVEGDVTVCRDTVTSPTSLIHGIMAEDLEIDVIRGTLTVTGGRKDKGTGGDAINCSSFVFENTGYPAVFTGGNGGFNEISEEALCGGDGIKASNVTINGDCDISGGDGESGGAGIRFTSSCQFDRVFCTVQGGMNMFGGERSDAILDVYDAGYSLAPHTVCDSYAVEAATHSYNWKEEIHPASYKVIFDPDGGQTYGGSTSPDILTEYYPYIYDLSRFTYYREGYAQVGWYITSGDLFFPLDAGFIPDENITLYAQWESIIGGNILLNGLKYRFSQYEHFNKYNGIATLPGKLLSPFSQSTPDQLVVWSNTLVPNAIYNSTYDLYEYPGAWYSDGVTLTATGSDMYILYAHEYPAGTTLVYHANGGTVEGGGNMIIEDCTGDLVNHEVADISECFSRPQFEFAGWYETPVSTPQDLQLIQAGDTMSTPLGTRQDLYAVWRPITHYEYASGEVEMEVSPTNLTAIVSLSEDWCTDNNVQTGFCVTYDENGQMIGIYQSTTVDPVDGGGLQISVSYTESIMPTCNLFVIGTSNTPVAESIELIE